jgi:hypothetical protein
VGLGREGFDAVQGARATYTVGQFSDDGLPDLVAADCFGVVRYFRQATRQGPGAAPRFEPPVEIGKLRIRAAPCAADWNGDGRLDVVVASSSEDAFVFFGRGGNSDPPFQEGKSLELPYAPAGAGAPIMVADFNGDGDQDIILLTAYGYCCFYEHSFLESRYAIGEAVTVERRPDNSASVSSVPQP